MPPTPHDAARLYDMVQAAEVMARYLQGRRRDDLDHDAMLRDALERRIEISGEAARGLSTALPHATPEIPWRKIIAFRNILAHEYDEINDDILWRIATTYVPETAAKIRPLVPPTDTDSGAAWQ